MKVKDLKRNNKYLLNNLNRFEYMLNQEIIFRGKVKEDMPLNRVYEFAYNNNNYNDISLSNVIYLNELEVNNLIECNKKIQVHSIYNLNKRICFYTNKEYAEYIYNERYYMNTNITIINETITLN